MKKINVLTQNVYNRIAAGEVVDRPYSAVKELIENSLDAGASEIEIYIEKGGKQLIKVVDNGSGIERDDLHDAFMPHATSKISKASDLDFICTLGFRGEALASISAIAKVEIISVTEGNQAWEISCNGGEVSDVFPAALDVGTTVTVRDLFYNTPVRAKFLNSDKKEEADITNFVTRYILGNPYVTIKYYVDGKLELQSFGGGLDEAVAQVYGAKVLSECYKINAEKDGFRLQGYIGNQNFFKPNKTYQSVFLNGRYIVNNTIATAVNNAYASYAMKRQYPFYVLNLDIPYDFVDVNVHPNKADVRFLDNRRVFGVVYSIISPILDGTAKAAEFVIDESRLPEIKSTVDDKINKVYSDKLREEIGGIVTASANGKQEIKRSPVAEDKKPSNKFDPVRDLPMTDYLPRQEINIMRVTDDSAIPNVDDFKLMEKKSKPEQQALDLKSYKFKGNLFDTYLIYEVGDRIFLIDQHAAHERLLYDGLIKKLNERSVIKQPMLVPYIFNVNAAEMRFIDANLKVLRSMGFGIDLFSMGAYRIDEVPVDLQQIDIKGFIDDILSQIDSLKGINVVDIMKEKLAMTACKHAIKGGMRLTDMEVDALFKMLDGNMGLKCPHGRPICVTLTKKDIEKMFKRIV